MKVAHFAIFSPHASGQYGTVKDLILAERRVGLDAQFIDCGLDKSGAVREGLTDGHITTMPLNWAMEADVVVRHTSVPDSVYKAKPVILALHGRPENSFNLERFEKSPIISMIRQNVKRHKAHITFWKEYVYYWEFITQSKVNYIPSLVNTDEYDIYGEKHNFGGYKADINLICVDMWREDSSPFNLIFAAQYFKEKYYPNTKLHIYGAPVKKDCLKFLGAMQKNGVVGEVGGVIAHLDSIYRGADILLTPNIIATRTVREAMASGLPMVAPSGCKYTPYTAEPRRYELFADAIKDCYENIKLTKKLDLRKQAMGLFNMENTGKAMKELCEYVGRL